MRQQYHQSRPAYTYNYYGVYNCSAASLRTGGRFSELQTSSASSFSSSKYLLLPPTSSWRVIFPPRYEVLISDDLPYERRKLRRRNRWWPIGVSVYPPPPRWNSELIVVNGIGHFHIVNQIIERGLHNSDDEVKIYTTNLVERLEQVRCPTANTLRFAWEAERTDAGNGNSSKARTRRMKQ